MTAKALHHCPNCRAALACGHEHETPAVFSHNGKRCTAESHVDF
jgi:hypothetical protein